MASIEITPVAGQALAATRQPIQGRLLRLIDRLAQWPAVSGVKPLSDDLAGHWRLRTGDYRLQFRVEGDLVIVEKIGHRRDFYE